ncbi:hypothetical protein BV25DRAFT_1836667 [Artomyces pyxidatus]|uniref:Uncharacterized protein n=1 Tax=Artomyces pyxidatus TaxID=48021 RepID=A0ACB8T9E4_9AGAM|nr:hypothetical protein BV25DRAFT_1836667 [Artomyces pyxidatus]
MDPEISHIPHIFCPPPKDIFDPDNPPHSVLRIGADLGYANAPEWRVYQAACHFEAWPKGPQQRIAMHQTIYAQSMLPISMHDPEHNILFGEVVAVKKVVRNWVVFKVKTWSGLEQDLQVPERMAKLSGIWRVKQTLGDVEPDTISNYPTPHTPRGEGMPSLSSLEVPSTPFLYAIRTAFRQIFVCF